MMMIKKKKININDKTIKTCSLLHNSREILSVLNCPFADPTLYFSQIRFFIGLSQNYKNLLSSGLHIYEETKLKSGEGIKFSHKYDITDRDISFISESNHIEKSIYAIDRLSLK